MFLSGALRQCKSLSGYQRCFSLKTLTQRWSAQCVKPITPRQGLQIANAHNISFGAPYLSLQIFRRADSSFI